MRFEDWDVLLFAANEQSNAPLQEFRTSCFSLEERHGAASVSASPLITCFVPSLERDEPFNVSIHAWKKLNLDRILPHIGSEHEKFWQVKLTVDGHLVAVQTIGANCTWPQQIATSAHLSHSPSLRFPDFHRSTMEQSYWQAAADYGRIKLELSAGHLSRRDQGPLHFVKVTNLATFSFQHAPMDILRTSGVAWPHPGMPAVQPVSLPSRSSAQQGGSSGLGSEQHQTRVHSHHQMLPDQYANSSRTSRSSSGYQDLPPSSYPRHAPPLGYWSHQGQMTPSTSSTTKVRMASDQIDRIIGAISPGHDIAQQANEGMMAPPPLPPYFSRPPFQQSHGLADSPMRRHVDDGKPAERLNRRGESCSSDVSMHPECPGFPNYVSENAHGQVVHTPAKPAATVRGRKEGSSPVKRKSVAVDGASTESPEEPQAKKPRGNSTGLPVDGHGPPEHGAFVDREEEG